MAGDMWAKLKAGARRLWARLLAWDTWAKLKAGVRRVWARVETAWSNVGRWWWLLLASGAGAWLGAWVAGSDRPSWPAALAAGFGAAALALAVLANRRALRPGSGWCAAWASLAVGSWAFAASFATGAPQLWGLVWIVVAVLCLAVFVAWEGDTLMPLTSLLVTVATAVTMLIVENLNDFQTAAILSGAIVVSVGFLTDTFVGSRGWYVVLIVSTTGATAFAVWAVDGDTASVSLDSGRVMLALAVAVAVVAGLLSWRILTWGWFWFIGAAGVGAALVISNGADGDFRRTGVILLVTAVAVGVASTVGKTTFRVVSLVLLALVALLLVLDGIDVREEGDEQRAQTLRDTLSESGPRLNSVLNCVARLELPVVDTTEPVVTEITTTVVDADTTTTETRAVPPPVPPVDPSSCALTTADCDEELVLTDDPTLSSIQTRLEIAIATVETLRQSAADSDQGMEDGDQSAEGGDQCALDGRGPEDGDQGAGDSAAEAVTKALSAATEVADIEVDLLAVELARRGGPEVATSTVELLADAEATAEAAAAAEAELSERDESLRQLLVDGANRSANSLIPGNEGEIELGPWGWLALAVLLLFGYRRLEITNNRRTSAPVVVEAPVVSGAAETDASRLKAVIEAQLNRAGLDEPAALPGSELTDEVVELLQDESLAGGRSVAAAMKTIKGIGFPTSGITVRTIVHQASDARTSVTVWVQSTRSKRPLYTESFVHADANQAVRLAGLYVARAALNYGRNVPAWGRWHSDDGTAFRLYHDTVNRQIAAPPLDMKAKIERLETALAASPATTQIRVELGHLEDIAGNRLRSLRYHLEARAEHKRLLVSGYRVATSASMLSCDLETQWYGQEHEDMRRGVMDLLDHTGVLRRASRTVAWRRAGLHDMGYDHVEQLLSGGTPAAGPTGTIAARKALLCIGLAELRRVRRSLAIPAILARATFQSERRYWLNFLRTPQHRQQVGDQYETAGLGLELQLALLNERHKDAEALEQRLDAILARPRAGSLALYNGACFKATLADHWAEHAASSTGAEAEEAAEKAERTEAQAVQLLHRSRRAGTGAYPALEWIENDPDLRPLHQVAGFEELLGWLRAGRELLDEERSRLAAAPEASKTEPPSGSNETGEASND